ncbi:hypothetical protein MSG28_012714 [Choristoneura fumiferana]|uniref:Uncharacterized protein n=1 Tax=Choristoneura fumiferana TaxID=7141 RepID=A0ACC0JII6_CHOFU|nr:hypothetical protein MSG28_012714 [Choristoneura fumiferana]
MAMVSEVKVNGAEPEAPVELPPALAERPAGLPPGKYSLVGWDMDTTGRRLIDEICQIAAYTPQQSYSQYIMPYGDLNPGARRRHNVRVVTVGRYRMLKDTNTHKKQRTKLNQYHHLLRYKLLDRFKSIVAGFADSYALAADKCKATVKSVSLRVLARVLLDADSLARKRVTQLRRLLADAGLLYSQLQDAWTNHKLEGTPPLRALYTLRPRAPRKRVTQLRRLLADAGLLYSQLQDAWTNHKLEGTPPLRALYTLRPRAPREARHAAAAAAGRRRAALLAAAGRLDQPQAGRYAPTACSVHTAAARPEGSASRSCGGCWPTPGCSTRSCRTPGPTTSWKVRPHCVLCTHCGRAPRGKRVTQLRRLLADAGLLYSQLQDTWTNHKLEGTPPLRALYTLRRAPEGSASRSCGGCWPTPGCSTRSCRTPGPTTSWKVRPTACSVHTAPRAPREARHAAAAAAGRRRAALLAAAGRLDQPQAGRYAPTACSVHTAAARPEGSASRSCGGCWPTPGCSTRSCRTPGPTTSWKVRPHCVLCTHCGRAPRGKRVTQLRRLLADAGLLYSQLQDAWTNHKLEGLEKQMAALSVSAKEEDIKELIDIFDCHFDPAKEPKGPKPRTPRNRIRATSTGETGEAGEPEGSTKLTGKR